MTFVEGIIGVPAVATINWDDPYIHSSDDDLYQIDQTQLRRNAFLIGSTAYVLAFAQEKDVPLFAGETFSYGMKRLANDLQVGMTLLAGAQKDSVDGWKDACILIEEGVQREIRAVRSSLVFDRAGNHTLTINDLAAQMKKKEDELLSDLRIFYKSLHGFEPKPLILNDSELSASKKIPLNVASLKTYFENRGKRKFEGHLHGLMEDEVYNFIDGKRSYYDIFKAVRAEQLAAGSWYYGTVTLGDVVGLIDALVNVQAVTLK
jgi:hypothetical protein